MSKSYLFINAKAGLLKGGTDTGGIAEAVKALDTEPEIFTGKTLTAMQTFIRAVKQDKPSRVLIAGGDGTTGIIIKALIDSSHTFGLIPTGTANNIAKSFSIPAEPEEAIAVINRGKTIKADAARAGQTVFLESAGVGYLANVMDRLGEQNTKKEVGKAIRHSVVEAINPSAIALTLTVDGESKEFETVWLTVTNMGRAAAIEVDPNAKPTDGVLEVVYFHDLDLRELPKYGLSLLRGKHIQEDKVTRLRGKKISLSMPRNTAVHIDGEVEERSRLSIEVMPGAFKVLVP